MSEHEGEEVRQALLTTLQGVSGEHPELRICQLIFNAIPREEMLKRNNDIFYIEDSQLLQYLQGYGTRFPRPIEENR